MGIHEDAVRLRNSPCQVAKLTLGHSEIVSFPLW